MSWFARGFFRRVKRRHFIAIDIGSNTAIRSLRFEETETEATVIKKLHFELPFREEERALIPLISEHLRRLIFQYLREIGHVPDGILIGLGNHFTFNEMAVARSERHKPEMAVHERELQELLANFLETHRTKILGEHGYTLAHLMPFRITIDGYPVETLTRETRGRVIEIALFATYADEAFWKVLYDLRSLLGGLELRFISDQAAVASALVAVLGIHDALIIKIGARMSEVSLLGDNAIRYTGQFDSGGDDVTTALAKRMKIDRADAERMKQQWGLLQLPEATHIALNDALRAAAANWAEQLVKLLKSEEKFSIPERVYLLGGGARLSVIRDALNSLPWFNELTFLESLDIHSLGAEDIASAIFRNTALPLSGPEEVSLAALAWRLSSHHGAILPSLQQS
jgi:hypothetical protein